MSLAPASVAGQGIANAQRQSPKAAPLQKGLPRGMLYHVQTPKSMLLVSA